MLWLAENTDWTYFFSNNHVGGLKAHDIRDYPFLLDIKAEIEEVIGQKFNAILINEYIGGSDKLDWHDDNDKWLGPQNKVIVPSLSFGSERDFQLRLKNNHNEKITLKTVEGSLMVMKGLTQVDCHHQVPERASVKGIRYNLTFRYIHPDLVGKMPKGSKKTLQEAANVFPELKRIDVPEYINPPIIDIPVGSPIIEDFDKECGFWFYNRPYVWIQGSTKETSGRLYLFYKEDTIHIYTRKGYVVSGDLSGRQYKMMERRIPYSEYRYYKGQTDDKFGEVSSLDLWGRPHAIESCSWATRYFGVYVPQRDGKLEELDIRRNGEKFSLPASSKHELASYLKAAGFNIPGGTNFIKLPNWLDWETFSKLDKEHRKIATGQL